MKGEVRKTGSVSRKMEIRYIWYRSAQLRPGRLESLLAIYASWRSRDHRTSDNDCCSLDAGLQHLVHALDHILAKRPIQQKPELLRRYIRRTRLRSSLLYFCPGSHHRSSVVLRFTFPIQQLSTSPLPHSNVIPIDHSSRPDYVGVRKGYRHDRFQPERQLSNVPHDNCIGYWKVRKMINNRRSSVVMLASAVWLSLPSIYITSFLSLQ